MRVLLSTLLLLVSTISFSQRSQSYVIAEIIVDSTVSTYWSDSTQFYELDTSATRIVNLENTIDTIYLIQGEMDAILYGNALIVSTYTSESGRFSIFEDSKKEKRYAISMYTFNVYSEVQKRNRRFDKCIIHRIKSCNNYYNEDAKKKFSEIKDIVRELYNKSDYKKIKKI